MARWIQRNVGEDIGKVGVASFGPLVLDEKSPDYGNVAATPKPHWGGFPLIKALKKKVTEMTGKEDVGFAIDTDVNACALLEFHAGGHEGVSENLAYVTVGTGIGVGLVVNKQVVHGLTHPEGGHMFLHKHPRDADFSGSCPFHGTCLEGLACTGSLAKRKWVSVQ